MKPHAFVLLLSSFFCFSLFAEKLPRWISEPYSECSKVRELCAVGEATGLMSAEVAARNAMARIFESQVSSVTQSHTTASDVNFEESFHQSVKVSTDFLLRGALMKKNFVGKESVFVLLALDKSILADDLKLQMKKIDQINLEAYQLKRRTMLAQIQQNLEERAQYHRTYQFLTQKKYPAAFDERKLLQWKSVLRNQNTTVFIRFNKSTPNAFRHLVLTELMSQEYRVVENDLKPYDWILDVNSNSNKLHLNVKGFEKYEFTLELTALNRQGVKVGHVQLKKEETGRHLNQAFEVAAPAFKKLLLSDFDKLNMNE